MLVVNTNSVEETRALGRALGTTVPSGMVVALVGDLGTGKTAFSQGFAAGLGVGGQVQSPTFVVAQDHPGDRLALVHADLYRVESEAELEQVGLEDRMDGETVVLVEWADRFPQLLPPDHLVVRLLLVPDPPTQRRIELVSFGTRAAGWLRGTLG